MTPVDEVSAGTPRRTRLSRDERQRRIIEAGLKVFGDRGFRGVSMSDVAAECGVTKGLLYEHYSSKEELYDACVEQARADLFDRLEAAIDRGGPDPLRNFIDEYFDYMEANRDRSWLLYGDASAAAVNRMRDRNAAAVAGMITRVVGPAAERVSPQQLLMLAAGLVGQGEHLARYWTESTAIPRVEIVASHYAMASGAIAAVLNGK